MTGSSIEPIAAAEFNAEVVEANGELSLFLRGNADMRIAPLLEGYLPRVHAAAVAAKVAEVVVDLRGLEFMNSSCFKGFVTWLNAMQEMPPDEVYVLRLRSDPQKHWQKRSLSALACFAVDLVHVDG